MKSAGKSLGLLIGLGGKGSDSSEPDGDESAETLAAKALMKALKGDDPSAVVEAFREMSAACESYGDEESDDEE